MLTEAQTLAIIHATRPLQESEQAPPTDAEISMVETQYRHTGAFGLR